MKHSVELSFTVTVDCIIDVMLDIPDCPDDKLCEAHQGYRLVKRLIDMGYIDWIQAVASQYSMEEIMKHSKIEHCEVLSVKI